MSTSLDRFLENHPAVNKEGSQEFTRAIWGGIAQEYDALKDQIKIVSADSAVLENVAGDMLDELALRFTGIPRVVNESDESRLKILFAFFRRSGQKSWATKHAIKGSLAHYFPVESVNIMENAVETNQVLEGGFEAFDVGVKGAQFGSWIPTGTSIEIVTGASFHGAKSLKGVGTGAVSQSFSATAGALILSFAYRGALNVQVQRTSDSKYWDFTAKSWVASASLSLSTENTRYDIIEKPVILDANATVKVVFSLNSAEGTEFHIDDVSFGAKPSYPYIRVLVSTEGQSGEYLNNWPGSDDPVAGTDYENATFLEVDFIGGEGGGIPTTFYQTIVDYIKPAGVKAVFEFVGRG